jgi:primase-polymerase (primpol)-like protein
MSHTTSDRPEQKSQKRAFYAIRDRKPTVLAPDFERIPAELRGEKRWVLWRLVRSTKGTARWDKVPHQSNGEHAKSNDPSTWATFKGVVAAYRSGGYDGIGFMLGGGFAGIDLDDVRNRETGEITAPWAAELIEQTDSYVDISPSGTGVKVVGTGIWTGKFHKRPHPAGTGEVEVYDSGRFFCITGQAVKALPVDDIQSVLDDLARLFDPVPGADAAAPGTSELSDEAIIERASTAKNGAKFRALWAGDTTGYASPSEADLALCSLIAFWTGPDKARIDQLFRRSKLWRPKWDERHGEMTYGEMTIARALDGKTEFHVPGGEGPPTEGEPSSHTNTDGQPTIFIGADELRVNDDAIAALASEEDVYQRGGILVQVIETDPPTDSPAVVRRPVGVPTIRELPAPTLRERLTRCARWVTRRGGTTAPAHPPGWCVNAVGARKQWPNIRHLDAVVTHPVLLGNGSILSADGYDPASGLLVRVPSDLAVEVPDRPRRSDAEAAVAELLDVVCDFPFATSAHEAAWVAGVLTPLAWFAFRGPAPWFLIDKNVRGAGAGLLSDVIALIVTGRSFAVMSFTPEREELRKRITTLAVEGERLVLLDNLTGGVGNDVLDAALTAERWKDRLLGGNRVFDGPLNVVWYGTGNNVQIQGDTLRRVCPIRLESPEERPDTRNRFRYDPLRDHVRESRGRLLSAALTILRAWIIADRPRHGLTSWGSYEGWSGVVREALVYAGLPDPGETRLVFRSSADREESSMTAILSVMRDMDRDSRGLTTAEIIDRVKGPPPDDPPPRWYIDLRSAIEELCGRLDGRTLGYRFRHFQRRNFGGQMLDKASPEHGVNRWVVRSATEIRSGPDHVPHLTHRPLAGGHDGHGGHDPVATKSAEADEESLVLGGG